MFIGCWDSLISSLINVSILCRKNNCTDIIIYGLSSNRVYQKIFQGFKVSIEHKVWRRFQQPICMELNHFPLKNGEGKNEKSEKKQIVRIPTIIGQTEKSFLWHKFCHMYYLYYIFIFILLHWHYMFIKFNIVYIYVFFVTPHTSSVIFIIYFHFLNSWVRFLKLKAAVKASNCF